MPTVSKIRFVLEQAKRRPPHTAELMALHAMETECSGSSPRAQPQLQFLLVATDYITK